MLEYIKEFSPFFDHIQKMITDVGKRMNIPIIMDETAIYLQSILPLLDITNVLELGSGLGYSTYVFAKYTKPDVKVISVDISKETIDRCRDILKISSHYNKIDWIHSDALKYIENSDLLEFNFFFIDAQKEYYSEYFKTIINKKSGKGVIILDNLFLRGGVLNKTSSKEKAMDSLSKSLFLRKDGVFYWLPIGDGLGVFYYNK